IAHFADHRKFREKGFQATLPRIEKSAGFGGTAAIRNSISLMKLLASSPSYNRRPQWRASCGGLDARLLARGGRSPVPPLRATADELEQITPLLLKSGAAGMAWRKIRDSSLRVCFAASQLQQAYRLYSLEAALHQRRLKQVIPLLRSMGVEPV